LDNRAGRDTDVVVAGASRSTVGRVSEHTVGVDTAGRPGAGVKAGRVKVAQAPGALLRLQNACVVVSGASGSAVSKLLV